MLEIILDEPIDLEEVKVEEVILNSRGQRAIRLDAWARSSDKRQLLWRCRMIQKRMM